MIKNAYSFLVHPGRGVDEKPVIGGASLSPESDVGTMLGELFERSGGDCRIDIVFSAAEDGSQRNSMRELVLNLIRDPKIDNARDIAEQLMQATTKRSGLGLFFVLVGNNSDGKLKKIYLARFPADSAISAREYESGLKVELLQQVFMKNAHSYKAAVYEGSNLNSDFFGGKAIDKQVSSRSTSISGYWIKDFLKSDFKTTSALGTKRFAEALKRTINDCGDDEVRHELVALATLAKNFRNKVISIDSIGKTFNLSMDSTAALVKTLGRPEFAFSKFVFSVTEFHKHIKYRQVHLSNGGVLTAPAGKFDTVFERKDDVESKIVTFETRGKVVNEALTKRAK